MTEFDLLEPGAWFRGRVALVTGASSGMGAAIALALGRAGARVGVNYRGNQSGAEEVCRRIRSAGGSALALKADVSREEEVAAMFASLEAEFGPRLDMLINNAGDWMDKCPVAECDVALWDRIFAVNARSVFLCSRHAAQVMTRQGEGAILNIGSLAGHTGGGGGTVPYAAAKAAVHTFTRGLARELAPHGVRVNAIAPGMVRTPMLAGRVSDEAEQKLSQVTPLGRMGRPEEISAAAMLLLSPASSFMTGEIVEINGGLLMQ